MTTGAFGREADAEPTSTGLGPETAAVLAYALWWVSGALMLALEPRHRFVRFHARQALVGFGTLWAVGVAVWAASFLAAFVSPSLFRFLAVLGPAIWLAGLALWVTCIVQAWRGEAWRLPLTRGR
ncbi:MAG: DUF4870 domain-containing protein [Acidobacteria bacterium]|nr:DUF4870 domain-containing protein [Acidobacteriota bacterium]